MTGFEIALAAFAVGGIVGLVFGYKLGHGTATTTMAATNATVAATAATSAATIAHNVAVATTSDVSDLKSRLSTIEQDIRSGLANLIAPKAPPAPPAPVVVLPQPTQPAG